YEFVIKVLFRSHDFYQALIYNLQGLKYTGTYVASMINEQPKRMILDSARPHIYWYNIDYCKQITQR
ncbi:hypothetical protein, partial [Methanospirillum sp.]|uniref:hypothetical protein n=1 Tax=Methanospirillum sp. TaxID=45200 RepID=UPI002CD28F46